MPTASWLEGPRSTGNPSSDPGNGSLGIHRGPMAEVCGLFWLQHLLGMLRSWPATSYVKSFEFRPESAFSMHECKSIPYHCTPTLQQKTITTWPRRIPCYPYPLIFQISPRTSSFLRRRLTAQKRHFIPSANPGETSEKDNEIMRCFSHILTANSDLSYLCRHGEGASPPTTWNHVCLSSGLPSASTSLSTRATVLSQASRASQAIDQRLNPGRLRFYRDF